MTPTHAPRSSRRSAPDGPAAHRQRVRRYFGFVDAVGHRLRDERPTLGRHAPGPLTARFPGLRPLFDSMVSASETQRNARDRFVEDWNPFSQRLLISDERIPAMSVLEERFALVPSYVQTFVEWTHEAMHILALEPFFTGHRPITGKADFVRTCLSYEALAFWYADMVVTPGLRAHVPGAELAFCRRSVSNTAFHPEQAFASLGLADPGAILALYLDAFLGRRGALADDARPYPATMARQVHDFYRASSETLASWYDVLAPFDLFDGWYRRFCAIPGLPSLHGEQALAAAGAASADEGARRLGLEWLPEMEARSRATVERVAVRRHLQTRAYFAWFVRGCLERGWVMGLSGRLDRAALDVALARYLEGLADALVALAGGGGARAGLARMRALDALYERTVRAPLDRADAHVKYRYRLFPFFAPTGGVVGVADDVSGLSVTEMTQVVWFVMKRVRWADELTAAGGAGLLRRLQAFLTASAHGDPRAARRAFNRFMRHPAALRRWSARLADIAPGRNRFEELAFEYT